MTFSVQRTQKLVEVMLVWALEETVREANTLIQGDTRRFCVHSDQSPWPTSASEG